MDTLDEQSSQIHNLQVGCQVEAHNAHGIVRFIGTTHFAAGRWVGIELATAAGKNDGSVQGERYFDCAPNLGVFVRPPQIKKIISWPVDVTASDTVESPAAVDEVDALVPVSATLIPDRRATIVAGGVKQTVPLREYEELRMRLKIMEGKRADDRQRVKEGELLRADMELINAAKLKLTVKVDEQYAEIQTIRKVMKDTVHARELLEKKNVEQFENLEMLTLDKEMAEERADTLQLEMEELKETVEELTLNLEVFRHEQEERNLMMHGSDQSQEIAFSKTVETKQLDMQNERLREALVKLRDVTTAQESASAKRIKQLERECQELETVKAALTSAESKIIIADDQMEYLKEQLDDALENNDMIEKLTENNMKMTELVDHQKNEIEDLESLRELNEELEENHVATENELEQEIEAQESEIRQLTTTIETLKTTNADNESVIISFRDLVQSLQRDIESLRGTADASTVEVSKLASQTQAMLSLNMQLQSKASKSLARAIDVDLRSLEAEQAHLYVEITKSYLPTSYFLEDDKSVQSVLAISRLAKKSELICKYLDEKAKHSHQNMTATEVSSGALLSLSSSRMNIQALEFDSVIERQETTAFLSLGSSKHALTDIEKQVDSLVEQLKSDLLFTEQAVKQFEQLNIDLSNTMAIHYTGDIMVARVDVASARLSFFARVIDHIGDDVNDLTKYAEENDHGHESFDLIRALSSSVKDMQNMDDIRKLIVKLNDSDSTWSIIDSIATQMKAHGAELDAVFRFFQQCNMAIRESFSDANKNLIDLKTIVAGISKKVFGKVDVDPPFSVAINILKSFTDSISSLLSNNNTLAKHPKKIVNPWTARAQEIKASFVAHSELLSQITVLESRIVSLEAEVVSYLTKLQEKNVKIELLDSRLKTLREQDSGVKQDDRELEKLLEKEQAMNAALETLQLDLDALEVENGTLQKKLKEHNKKDGKRNLDFTQGIPSDQARHVASAMIHHLRDQNQRLKVSLLKDKISSLAPLKKQKLQDTTSHDLARKTRDLAYSVAMASASMSVLDLSKLPASSDNKLMAWTHSARLPQYQLHKIDRVFTQIQHRKLELDKAVTVYQYQPQTKVHTEPLHIGSVKLPGSKYTSKRQIFVDHDELVKLHASILPGVAWVK